MGKTAGTPAPGLDISRAPEITAREDEGVLVHIKSPAGDPLFYQANGAQKPVTIRIAGTYSKVYRNHVEAQRDRLFRRGRMPSGDQATRNQIELCAACILEWEGLTNAGTPLVFNRDNAVHLLTQLPWVWDQLVEAQGDHASFFNGSSPS